MYIQVYMKDDNKLYAIIISRENVPFMYFDKNLL